MSPSSHELLQFFKKIIVIAYQLPCDCYPYCTKRLETRLIRMITIFTAFKLRDV